MPGRLNRKYQQLILGALKTPGGAVFSDISFLNNCLPETDYDEVSLETKIMGRTVRSPFYINAVTGGTKTALKINAALSSVAAEFKLPMAVGSQKIALENKDAEASFKVVRQVNPEGFLWANIGSYANPGMVSRVVEMIGADAVQVHLNVPQELAMENGDYKFKGMINRLKLIVDQVSVPVMVKEVGFGIAREQALELKDIGISAIDIGGKGGTNFISVENKRAGSDLSSEIINWGIPTAISLIEVKDAVGQETEVTASGGINRSLDAAKALALGASTVGMAAYPVYILMTKGRRVLVQKIRQLEDELRMIMVMTGSPSLRELQSVPLVITGFTAEWMEKRGLEPSEFARKR